MYFVVVVVVHNDVYVSLQVKFQVLNKRCTSQVRVIYIVPIIACFHFTHFHFSKRRAPQQTVHLLFFFD